MLRTLALCLLLPLACLGSRTGQATQRDVHLALGNYYGVPELDAFYTTNPDEAATFLQEWAGDREFGLYIRVVPTENKAFFPVRVVLLGICRGTRVLVFDLRPFLREVPSPLPGPIADFLGNGSRTFFGMDLKRSAGRLAFEFDTVVQCVDYNVRAWPELRRGGGLYGVFNRFVSLDIDLWRPDNLDGLSSQARHTYLQWAVAHYFTTFYGTYDDEWIVSKSELFEAGPVYLRVPKSQHDWSKAREEWMKRKKERAAVSILRTLQLWRSQRRPGRAGGPEGDAGSADGQPQAAARGEASGRGEVRATRLDGFEEASSRGEVRASRLDDFVEEAERGQVSAVVFEDFGEEYSEDSSRSREEDSEEALETRTE